MNTTKNLGILASSDGTNSLSTTVTGIIIGSAVFIVMIAQWLGFEITTEAATSFAISVGAMISTMMIIYGVMKKIVIAIQQKFSPTPNVVTTEVVTTQSTGDDTVEIKTTTSIPNKVSTPSKLSI